MQIEEKIWGINAKNVISLAQTQSSQIVPNAGPIRFWKSEKLLSRTHPFFITLNLRRHSKSYEMFVFQGKNY